MATTQRTPTVDHHVKEAVLAELEWMPGIDAEQVGVAVEDGAVTLSGHVGTYPERRAAVRAALRVRGVSAVADVIEVHNRRSPRDDTDIARDARDVLSRTTAPVGSVKADVDHHVVTLTGSVVWNHEREAVEKAVAQLPGVREVSNLVELRPRVHVSGGAAKAKIAEALRRNAAVEADRIEVAVTGDTITLRGTVASWVERSQASHAAWSTPGVTHVRNELDVTR